MVFRTEEKLERRGESNSEGISTRLSLKAERSKRTYKERSFETKSYCIIIINIYLYCIYFILFIFFAVG
jgi:hypothetical protein